MENIENHHHKQKDNITVLLFYSWNNFLTSSFKIWVNPSLLEFLSPSCSAGVVVKSFRDHSNRKDWCFIVHLQTFSHIWLRIQQSKQVILLDIRANWSIISYLLLCLPPVLRSSDSMDLMRMMLGVYGACTM